MVYIICSLPLDANRGEVRGGLRRITSGPFDVMPTISLDAKWLVFATARGKKISPENAQVNFKDVDSEAETVISDAPTAEADPQISSDGSAISVDTIGPGEAWAILVGERRNLAWRRIPGKNAWDWSHNKRRRATSLWLWKPSTGSEAARLDRD